MKNIQLKQLFIALTTTFILVTPSLGQTNEVQISIKKGRFYPSEIEIPANTKVRFTVENFDDTPEEFESYDLNREVLIKANSKASFYVGPLSTGVYKFEGEFSPETAQGVVRVK